MPRGTRYRVVNKIAHGGMAEIFLAMQQGEVGFQKPVVLKLILPALAANPAFVRMLVDEAHIASTLNHSNLVQVLDLGKSKEQYFLVLEYVDGWSLEQVRRRAQQAKLKMPLPLVLSVVAALCRGLAYVHARTRDGKPLGIVHRDVTPQNVLVSREGEVKLADFGIAKAIGKTEKSATGVIKGKFAYMSPEQSRGLTLDARSDLFSVGSLLYLLVTGKKAFEGATDLDVIMQVRKGKFEKPSHLVKDLSPDVERFIARALRVDLEKRWQSAEQMADRLDAILMKLGQPSGPAPLKRWLEALAARDGAKPPAAAVPDASIAVELGSLDLELQEVSPGPTPVEEPEAESMPTHPLRASPDATRPEATAFAAPTRLRPAQSALLAAAARPREDLERTRPAADAVVKAALDEAPLTIIGRFGRWARRTTLRVAAIVVLLGAGFYFLRPYLPAWTTRPINAWLRKLPPPIGPGKSPDATPR
jgi:serine/threonine protein kinase